MNSKKILLSGLGIFLSMGFLLLTETVSAYSLPEEVRNVKATPGSGQITLKWDEAKAPEDVVTKYKIYYGIKSVKTENDTYEAEQEVPGDLTAYTLKNLKNGVEYFIGITAINSAGDESATYSKEVSAVPVGGGEPPKLISADQTAATQIHLVVSEKVNFQDFSNALVLTQRESSQQVSVSAVENNGTDLLISVATPLEAGKVYRLSATSKLYDADGNAPTSGNGDAVEFTAQDFSAPAPVVQEPPVTETPVVTEPPVQQPTETTPPPTEQFGPTRAIFEAANPKPAAPVVDTQAPLDATNLLVDSSELQKEGIVVLRWNRSLNLDNDVSDQRIFVRQGVGDWDNGYSVGPDLDNVELQVDLNQNYEVKLVTIDQAGNVSEGVVTSFTTQLPKTGPAAFLGLIVAFFVFTVLMSRRKHA